MVLPTSSEAHKAANKPSIDLKKAAGSAFAAFTIGSSVLSSPIANAVETQPFTFSSSNIVAEKVVRQGLYNDYEVDIVQERDDARSTFKDASETKSKKGTFILRRCKILFSDLGNLTHTHTHISQFLGKYTAILAILIVGSFIVPMAQYFWYVRDDDSTDKFFAEDVPEPPKKKGWFK